MTENLPPYILRRSGRSRNIRLTVHAGGRVAVSVPRRVSQSAVDSFVAANSLWLRDKVERFKKIPEPKLSASQEKRLFAMNKEKAESLAAEKVGFWNEHYRLPFKKISIRNSRSRWGSCSSLGTLSFNYKIVFLPERLADYLVAHELCHLKEPNHGGDFWALLAQTMPDYAVRRRALRDFERTFELPATGV